MSTSRGLFRQQGEAAKRTGMERAAGTKLDEVRLGTIAFLRVLLNSPDGTATIDDATPDLARTFEDGGRWRGTVCQSLAKAGVIEAIGAVSSNRPSRHGGYVTRWRLIDRPKAQSLLARLLAALDTKLTTAAALAAKSETAPACVLEHPADAVSIQTNLPF